LQIFLVFGPKRHYRGHVALVERRQHGSVLLRHNQLRRNFLAQGRQLAPR